MNLTDLSDFDMTNILNGLNKLEHGQVRGTFDRIYMQIDAQKQEQQKVAESPVDFPKAVPDSAD